VRFLTRVDMCCSVLQCGAVCCSVLKCAAGSCSALQCVALWWCVAATRAILWKSYPEKYEISSVWPLSSPSFTLWKREAGHHMTYTNIYEYMHLVQTLSQSVAAYWSLLQCDRIWWDEEGTRLRGNLRAHLPCANTHTHIDAHRHALSSICTPCAS